MHGGNQRIVWKARLSLPTASSWFILGYVVRWRVPGTFGRGWKAAQRDRAVLRPKIVAFPEIEHARVRSLHQGFVPRDTVLLFHKNRGGGEPL